MSDQATISLVFYLVCLKNGVSFLNQSRSVVECFSMSVVKPKRNHHNSQSERTKISRVASEMAGVKRGKTHPFENCCFELQFSCFRIMLCAMCGDPYPVELILGPLLHHQNCWRSSNRPDTIILETYLGFDKRRVQITLTSYHSK